PIARATVSRVIAVRMEGSFRAAMLRRLHGALLVRARFPAASCSSCWRRARAARGGGFPRTAARRAGIAARRIGPLPRARRRAAPVPERDAVHALARPPRAAYRG